MVSDQEPRYRLVDDEGNIVGSLYGKADGSIAIQETDSGSDREVTLAPDGTFSAPSVETESVSAGELTNGVAGGGQSISLIDGDAGDFRLVSCVSIGSFDVSFTNETYEDLTEDAERGVLDESKVDIQNLSNPHISWTIRRVDAPSGETVDARVSARGGDSYAVISVSDGGSFTLSSSRVPYNEGRDRTIDIQARTSGGEGRLVGSPTVLLWEEIA